MAVHDGIVREVYRIAGWLPAGSTMCSVRSLYRFKSVAHLFKPGDQNPVRYFRAEV